MERRHIKYIKGLLPVNSELQQQQKSPLVKNP